MYNQAPSNNTNSLAVNVENTYRSIVTDYAIHAEKAIKTLTRDKRGEFIFTTNQIRNLYVLVVPFFDLFKYDLPIDKDKSIQDLRKLKVKLAYQIGRDDGTSGPKGVKEFNSKTQVLELIDIVIKHVDFEKNLELYCHYFQALVSYHKYHNKSI